MSQAQELRGPMDVAHSADDPIDPLYRKLAKQHRSLEQQIDDLAARPHLSAEQALEEVRLKKQKLAVKDQMASLPAARGG